MEMRILCALGKSAGIAKYSLLRRTEWEDMMPETRWVKETLGRRWVREMAEQL